MLRERAPASDIWRLFTDFAGFARDDLGSHADSLNFSWIWASFLDSGFGRLCPLAVSTRLSDLPPLLALARKKRRNLRPRHRRHEIFQRQEKLHCPLDPQSEGHE